MHENGFTDLINITRTRKAYFSNSDPNLDYRYPGILKKKTTLRYCYLKAELLQGRCEPGG